MGRALARHLDADPERPRHHPQHRGQGRPLAGRRAPARSPSRASGPARPARPGSRRWTGCASATTSSATTRSPTGSASRSRRAPRRTCSTATRTFFRDCQEWEWIPRRFDPARALAPPRSIAALIGTDPRVIADDVWAKLLWAGLNLTADDLPGNAAAARYYPIELVRAVTLTWLFAGLRSDEIARLRVGCVRWQHDGAPIAGDSRDVLAERRRLPARRAGAQDRHRVHQAGRPAARAGHRRLAGRAPGAAAAHRTARPASTSTCCSPSAPSRVAKHLHQPHDHPGALPQGRRPRPPTSAATSPATGPARPSPASSTTPRNR